jgi:hypothetical protein
MRRRAFLGALTAPPLLKHYGLVPSIAALAKAMETCDV